VAAGRLHAGDTLTLGRLALTPLFVWNFAAGVRGGDAAGLLAGALFAVAAASDYFDGPLARRAGRASERGRTWDSWADIIFLESALVTAVVVGLTPWWVPAAIAASFAYYVADSWWRTRAAPRRTLIASRLGHLGGVCNYVLVGMLTYNEAMRLHLLGPHVLEALYLLVPLYSGAAIAARLGWPRKPRRGCA
jgi:phosphatidylglycerophosphate synthase